MRWRADLSSDTICIHGVWLDINQNGIQKQVQKQSRIQIGKLQDLNFKILTWVKVCQSSSQVVAVSCLCALELYQMFILYLCAVNTCEQGLRR